MTDDRDERADVDRVRDSDVEGQGVPDTDPTHLDPAGDLADAVEDGALDLELDDDMDRADLRAFVERAEAGEFDADPGLEATVRIARAVLEQTAGDDRAAGEHDERGE